MSAREEPSYMMFARANVRDNMATSPAVVRELLARIDRDARALEAAAAAASKAKEEFTTEWGVKSPWGLDSSKSLEIAENVAANMQEAGHEASVIWRGVTAWHHTITDERAMQPVEARS